MTRGQQVRTVASWEFRRFVKWKQQFVGLGIMLATAGAVWAFRSFSDKAKAREVTVAAVGAAALGAPLPAVPGVRWDTTTHVTESSARLAVADDSIGAALIVRSRASAELAIRKRAAWTDGLEAAIGSAQRNATFARLPLSATDRDNLATPFSLSIATVSAGGAPVSRGTRIFASVILGMALMILFTGFATLFTGITGEKQQRITEQMISMVSPQTWMDGKILGLSGAATAGTAVLAIGGFVVIRLLPLLTGKPGITIPPVASDLGLLLLVTVIAALGVLMWFSFMAAVAATIDDPNTSTRSILLFVPMIPMGLAFSMLAKADSTMAQVMALFPLTSMGMMPVRLLTTSVPFWEPVASILLLAAAAWFFRRAAGKIFATGVLMYGKEPTLSEVWRWARQS